jgi:hypothetical protein
LVFEVTATSGELLNDDPFGIKRRHGRHCDLLRGPRHLREIIGGNIENAACSHLWDHQRMTR